MPNEATATAPDGCQTVTTDELLARVLRGLADKLAPTTPAPAPAAEAPAAGWTPARPARPSSDDVNAELFRRDLERAATKLARASSHVTRALGRLSFVGDAEAPRRLAVALQFAQQARTELDAVAAEND